MCYQCDQRIRTREIEENRARIHRETYEYVAIVGRKTITADTFAEVGDQLLAMGYLMTEASMIADNTIRVPHATRKSAAVQKVQRERQVAE